MGVLKLTSFAASGDAKKTWRDDIIKLVVATLDKGYEKLVIDLRSNEGGDDMLGSFLVHLLDPTEYPINGVVEFPYTNETIAHLKKKLSSSSNLKIVNTTTLQKFDVENIPLVLRKEGNETVSRERNWTSVFSYNEDSEYESMLTTLPAKYRGKRLFTPQNLLAITDGLCGSACAQFVKHMKEKKLMRVISMGGSAYKPSNPVDIASVSAGDVVSSDDYQTKASLRANDDNSTTSPTFFYRSGTRLTFSMTSMLTFTPGETTPLEFTIVKPNDQIAYYPQASFGEPQELISVASKVENSFNRCYSGEVQEAKCTPSSSADKVKHAVYGHPCKDGGSEFDTTRCVFLRCENGYYQSDNTTCSKIPDSSKPTPEPSNKGGLKRWQIVLIISTSVSVFVVTIVVIIVVCCICNRRRRSAKLSKELQMGLLQNKDVTAAADNQTLAEQFSSPFRQINDTAETKTDAA